MKSKYLIFGIIVVILIVIEIVVYSSGDAVAFTIDNPDLKPEDRTVFSKIPLNEASAKILAEKAVGDDECLIFGGIGKEIDSRNGEEYWMVGFSCTDECDKVLINCGVDVRIKENTREVMVIFQN